MILEGMIVMFTAVLILLVLVTLGMETPVFNQSRQHLYTRCPSVQNETWRKVLNHMNQSANPPSDQPVYRYMRSVPKDVVSATERLYCKSSIETLSSGRL